jgi:hypothetical protein
LNGISQSVRGSRGLFVRKERDMAQDTRIRFRLTRSRIALTATLGLGACLSPAIFAKDLYVAPTGNNTVSYADNSINSPWASIEHGLYNLKAGDRLLIRGGTYTPKYPVWLSSDYNRQTKGGDPNEKNNAESGTASQPIVVQNYQDEKVTVNLVNVTSNLMGAYVYLDNKSYWTFRGLTFVNSMMVFVVGEDARSTNNTFEALNITANRGGDNAGGIHLWGANADYAQILNCVIKGPGQNVHLNTSTIYVKGVNNLKILGNVLSDAPIGIYFKHRNSATSASQANIEIAYNYVTNTSRTSMEFNGNYARIHDNIFGIGTTAAHFGDANGGAGGDYNQILHNTFLSGSLNFDSAIEGGDPYPGVVGNNVVNNIFQSQLEVLRYTTLANTNVFGRNVYPNSNPITSNSGGIKISSDSIVGTPKYVGGSSPTSISGFALTSDSIGKVAGTDGADMGANVAKMMAGAPPPAAPAAIPSAPRDVVAK